MDQVWEMQVRLVASNRIGSEIIETEHGKSEIKFYGNSFIVANRAYRRNCFIFCDDKEEADLIAEFDLDKIKSTRHCWGVFRNRRPDLYKCYTSVEQDVGKHVL
ncbi:N-carbamoylputrescine amidase-like isoform X2 [Vicia villosa]|uniref:N-carbamoylputrescine amidase-like isoform X2 n=1 Tax=Vicia villosa TaxID=3911 RepID=UPI00273BC433|nr:N-carbamoylputrescine amidase-like isoform X2 [Vicia villosa]